MFLKSTFSFPNDDPVLTPIDISASPWIWQLFGKCQKWSKLQGSVRWGEYVRGKCLFF